MSRSKAGTALADCALTYAQEKIGLSGSPPVAMDDSALIHAFAMIETMFHYAVSCPLPLDDEARIKVVRVFEITIGDVIDRGQMGWLDETIRRPFVLHCAEDLGAAAFEAGREGGVVTAPILDDAACRMVHDNQNGCPLRADPSQVRVLGTCCDILVRDLLCKLEEMNVPAGR